MTSIGSISGSESNYLTLLIQSLSKHTQTSQSDNAYVEESDSGTTNDKGIDSLKKKVDAAISEALKNLDKSASADKIMQTIKTAVESTMEANGVQLDAMRPPAPPSGSGEAGSMSPPPKGGPGGSDDFMSKIEALLEENGFDVEKFKSELASKMAQQSDDSSLDLLDDLNSSQGVDQQA